MLHQKQNFKMYEAYCFWAQAARPLAMNHVLIICFSMKTPDWRFLASNEVSYDVFSEEI